MNKEKNKNNIPDIVIDVYAEQRSSDFDPEGSWTGVPTDPTEKPIQDADDL